MKYLFITIILAASLCGCQPKQENSERHSSIPFEAERNIFFSHLKDPTEVALKLKATSIGFNADLMNDAKSFGMYANNPVKAAANLGLYLSDLNYSIAYQQSSYTEDLFTAAHELSKIMGVEQDVLNFLMKRYRDNLSQNDSAKSVVDALFDKTTKGLQGTDRERLVGITMAAYQIENLHIALGLLDGVIKNTLDKEIDSLLPLYQVVAEQKSQIEITYGFLRSITDVSDPRSNPNLPYYAKAFEELIGYYKRLNIDEKMAAHQTPLLMKEDIKELTQKVNVIRNKIISIE